MRLNYLIPLLLIVCFSQVFSWGQKYKEGDVISSNASGVQGDYHVEYWKDGGSGSMTLGAGCDFSCQWGQVNNILFRKGIRPGSKEVIVSYSADYKPQGNSYLSLYGWFDDNPLVEYYIIESYGTWNPASDGSRTKHGSIESDSGTYDLFENSRTGESIRGYTTFKQYWSIRKKKRTSGIITCANHFAAWEKAGIKVGKFYEVSFNVEAYQSPGGQATVEVKMYNSPEEMITTSILASKQTVSMMPLSNAPIMMYNILGQRIDGFSAPLRPGQHPVILNAPSGASGIFYSHQSKK